MVVKQLDKLGQSIFDLKYKYPSDRGWGDRARSVAKHVASAERDDNKEKWEKKFYDSIAAGDLVPGGRILFGAGRHGQNLLNCYSLVCDDNVNSIATVIANMYKISCAGGGIGFSFSKIRPKGDDIQVIKNSAPGSVSVMKMINEIGEHVRAGASRRTALLAILNVDHPDLLDFLHVKLDKKELTNFNISVGVTEKFLKACEREEDWNFVFNNKKYFVYQLDRISQEGNDVINVIALDAEDAVGRAAQHHKKHFNDQFDNVIKITLKAKELWNKIWENSVETGCPGIFNVDLVNKYTNVSYFERMENPNPCGEVPLPNFGNCCLGHINLAQMVENGEVDWRKLANTVRTGIRFLDNVLTVNPFPIEECREVGHKSRRIGLGTTGLHYMLIKLGIRYGSEKCIEFLERLYATIRNEAYLASMYIAEEKGSFPAFDADKFLNEEFAQTLSPRIRMLIKRNGIRNAILLTCAPVGTVSMVLGCSTGLEPIFSPMYLRRYREANVWRETVVVDPLFKEMVKEGKPLEELQNLFPGAYDVTPHEHMSVQATIQKYVDSSLSKTINLPAEAKASEFADIALSFAPYLKGMTVYRAASKSNEPLSVLPLTEETIKLYITDEIEAEVTPAACSINGECSA